MPANASGGYRNPHMRSVVVTSTDWVAVLQPDGLKLSPEDAAKALRMYGHGCHPDELEPVLMTRTTNGKYLVGQEGQPAWLLTT